MIETPARSQFDGKPHAEPALPDNAPRTIRTVYVIGVAIPLIVLNCGWIANSEMRNNLTEGTVSTLFLGVVFILFCITLANLLVRRLLGAKAAFNQAELMLLYTMLSMSSAISGVSYLGFLTPFLVAPFHDAAAGKLASGFVDILPSYIGPRDPAVLQGFYKGHSTFFQPHIMAAWAGPLVTWGVFLLVLLFTQLCLCSLVRKRWADEEHLPFPVIALPLEMTREGAPIYRNKLFALGFAVPLFFHSLNTIAGLNPNVPSLRFNTVHDISSLMNTPWTGVNTMFVMLHPVGIGFGYLVSTDALFSLWFFYLVNKAAGVLGVSLGWCAAQPGSWDAESANQFPFLTFQSWGAWIAVLITVIWTSRGYFGAYFNRAVRGDISGIDKGEALGARWAFGGFAVGFLLLCTFIWVQGGSLWLPIVFFGGYLTIMLGIARVRAEMPILCNNMHSYVPQEMTSVFGQSSLNTRDIVHLGVLSWFNLDSRSAAMPQELEGMVGLKRARSRLSPIVTCILIASVIAIAAAMMWDLQMYYVSGAESADVQGWRNIVAVRPWSETARYLNGPVQMNNAALPAMGFGCLMVFILAALRTRFIDFPLVPAAYTVNVTGMNDFFWCDMLVAWIIKVIILRYGGRRLYQAGLPFFLGLICGDFTTGGAWTLYGTLTHETLFRTFPT